MTRTSRAALHARVKALAPWPLLLVLLSSPLPALAGEYGLKLEPGVAFPLTAPQSDRFDMGGGGAVKLLFGLGPILDLTVGGSYVGLPRSSGSASSESGTAWGVGPGLRLKAAGSHADGSAKTFPWIDGDALFVRTGSLNRFGVAGAVGLAFPFGDAGLWLGPYVRYQQIFGRGEGTVDDRDAKLLLAGLSLEFGTKPERRPSEVAPVVAAPAPAPIVVPAADRDGDGTLDLDDRCPDVVGPVSNQGCPVYQKVIVTPDKLELTEKIQFALNSPVIEPVSHPTLDEVVKALQDHEGFTVRMEGHASSEGTEAHNQQLSEQRAQAVLDYLASHGVAPERLSSKGFAASVPAESNTTTAGREANRRVEFAVTFVVVNPGSGQ